MKSHKEKQRERSYCKKKTKLCMLPKNQLVDFTLKV